jgi:hypothetical protein
LKIWFLFVSKFWGVTGTDGEEIEGKLKACRVLEEIKSIPLASAFCRYTAKEKRKILPLPLPIGETFVGKEHRGKGPINMALILCRVSISRHTAKLCHGNDSAKRGRQRHV